MRPQSSTRKGTCNARKSNSSVTVQLCHCHPGIRQEPDAPALRWHCRLLCDCWGSPMDPGHGDAAAPGTLVPPRWWLGISRGGCLSDYAELGSICSTGKEPKERRSVREPKRKGAERRTHPARFSTCQRHSSNYVSLGTTCLASRICTPAHEPIPREKAPAFVPRWAASRSTAALHWWVGPVAVLRHSTRLCRSSFYWSLRCAHFSHP